MAASGIKSDYSDPLIDGKCSIQIPEPETEWYLWDVELSPKSKLISNLHRLNSKQRVEKNGVDVSQLKHTSYDFNQLKFRSGILSGVDHSWSVSLKPECSYITTTLELPDDSNFCMGITDNSHLEIWHEKDGKPEIFMHLKIQYSKTANTKRNSWTNQARLLDTSWTEKVTMFRINFNLSVQPIVRASAMGLNPLLPATVQPLTNGNNDTNDENNNNSTISIGMQLLNSGQLSDVILVCEGTEIPAHRLILSSRSSVFCAMFQQKQMKEAQEGRVILEEIHLSALKLMLKFVYTGKLEPHELEEYDVDLYTIADRFGIMDLKSLCSQQLQKELKAGNAVEIYALGNAHNDQLMMNAALQVIKYNRKEAFKHAETLKEFCVAFPETMFELFQTW